MIYQWKPESHIKIDAQAAGLKMEQIRVRNNGRLEPSLVVEEAKKKNSVLHPHFEWDDGIAATKYRKDQASYLIRSIEVTVKDDGGASQPIRAFVSVVREKDRSYTSVQHAMSDEELREQVIKQAWKELQAWKDRHKELMHFAKVFAVIEEVKAA